MPTRGDRKVLVTGATGFIGRALLPALRGRGCPVIAASRRPMTSTIDADGIEWRTSDHLCDPGAHVEWPLATGP